MEYSGIDYTKKTANENTNILFNSVCVELIKRNKSLFKIAQEISRQHINVMIDKTAETDKKRDVLLELAPTWRAMMKEVDNIKMLD